MISQQLIQEFQEILLDDYGIEMSEYEAKETAADLISYFEILYQVQSK